MVGTAILGYVHPLLLFKNGIYSSGRGHGDVFLDNYMMLEDQKVGLEKNIWADLVTFFIFKQLGNVFNSLVSRQKLKLAN